MKCVQLLNIVALIIFYRYEGQEVSDQRTILKAGIGATMAAMMASDRIGVKPSLLHKLLKHMSLEDSSERKKKELITK